MQRSICHWSFVLFEVCVFLPRCGATDTSLLVHSTSTGVLHWKHMVHSFHVSSFAISQVQSNFFTYGTVSHWAATHPQHRVQQGAAVQVLTLRSGGSPVDLQHPGPLSEDATDQRCHRCLCPSLFAHRGRFSADGNLGSNGMILISNKLPDK
jgi:hypothetical protein